MTNLISISSASESDLMIRSATISERLGELFNMDIEFESKDASIDLTGMLSTSMTIKIEADEGFARYFNGMVCEAEQTGVDKVKDLKFATYRVKLVPKPWLLGNRIDCRIFKDKSTVDIIKLMLQEIGYSDIETNLSASYPPREYCVQYREDGLNFIQRLMQQEGIYYFFKHDAGSHTLVLADGVGAHSEAPGFTSVPYQRAGDSAFGGRASIVEWASLRGVDGVNVSLTDYNPLTPKASLLSKAVSDGTGGKGVDVFDYPGTHQVGERGKHYAQMRAEAKSAARSRYAGATYSCHAMIGGLFNLTEYPRGDCNQKYLITATAIIMSSPGYAAAGKGGSGPTFRSRFEAMESKLPFRNMATAEQPVVVGLQTGIVTGNKNEGATEEDIVVDKYGRVQVNFHWNMPDKNDADNSCPVRVATMWAGKNWGSVSYPRVGQEVVVSFIEGDPDRPLIVGNVYNADNMPPYTLPDNKTQSGIKSRSLLGEGKQFNELRFEDKKDAEEFHMHAQKLMTVDVEDDQQVKIGNRQVMSVHHSHTMNVGPDWTHVDGEGLLAAPNIAGWAAKVNEVSELAQALWKTEFSELAVSGVNFVVDKVDEKCFHDVAKGTHTTNISGVGGQATNIVATEGQKTLVVSEAGQGTVIALGPQKTMILAGSQGLYVHRKQEEIIGSERHHTVKGDDKLEVKGKREQEIEKDDALTIHGGQKIIVKKKHSLDVTEEILLTCGNAVIKMESSGNISITCGPGNFKVNGMNVDLKADTAASMKGATTEVNGSGETTIKGGAAVNVQGGVVKHN